MVSEKTNQVMKVLTIMATIFIPFTFLSGLYGMNFDPEVSPFNMPELKWRYGYPAFLAVIALTFVGMMWFFRRKGWIGQPGGRSTRGRDGFIRQDSKDLRADPVIANQQDQKAQ
jgi:magnesium transporter